MEIINTSKRSRFGTIGAAFLFWTIFQIYVVHYHRKHDFSADSQLFTQHFNLIPFGRTNAHTKDITYWFEWLQDEGKFLYLNSTLTLLHFDAQCSDDQIMEEIHTCAPGQLLNYDKFVNEV